MTKDMLINQSISELSLDYEYVKYEFRSFKSEVKNYFEMFIKCEIK